MRNRREIFDGLQVLLKEKIEELPEQDIQNISEDIHHHEWGVAFETLCVQIYEYDIPVNTDYYNRMANLGKSMNIDPSYWLPLKKLIADNHQV